VLAAQDRAVKGFQDTVAAAYAKATDWPSGVAEAVGAALDYASLNPGAARLLLASSHALAEPQLAGGGMVIRERLVEHLRDGTRRSPGTRIPDDMTERAAIGAAGSIVATSMAEGRSDTLSELAPDITRIILEPYLGRETAERVAMNR
jgi:hypothetical protein